MALTPNQAQLARTSMLDVFTPDEDAGVISTLRTFNRPGARLQGKGQCARVVGAHVDKWFPISDLEASPDLLRLEERDARGERGA